MEERFIFKALHASHDYNHANIAVIVVAVVILTVVVIVYVYLTVSMPTTANDGTEDVVY